mgnify:CR=1 FL=1
MRHVNMLGEKMDEVRENFLYEGDKVMWAGAWGNEPYKEATVKGITIVEPGTKYGEDVPTIHWNFVKDRNILLDLDNGHWCWAFQVKRIECGRDT